MDLGVEYRVVGEIILASQGYFGGYSDPSAKDYRANFAMNAILTIVVLDNLGYLVSYFTMESQEGPSIVHLAIAGVQECVSITIDNCRFVDKFL